MSLLNINVFVLKNVIVFTGVLKHFHLNSKYGTWPL